MNYLFLSLILSFSLSYNAFGQEPAKAAVASQPVATVQKIDNKTCLECHADNDPTVDENKFNASVHGALDCIDCHTDIKDASHPDQLNKVNCGNCHDKVALDFSASIHAKFANSKDNAKDYPSCTSCHGIHEIMPKDDPQSAINHFKSDQLCLNCHTNSTLTKTHANMPSASFIKKYTDSVHGRAVHRKGLTVAPTCSDCHGGHKILPASDLKSKVNRANIPQTCGKCHEGILTDYLGSIHGQMFKKGNPDAPVCTTCHNEHGIDDPLSSGFQQSMTQECGHCHQTRISTYADTFHGKSTYLGYTQAAKCSSCHTSHKILPATDINSTIHKNQLKTTCSQCHSNVNENFTKYDPHLDPHNKNDSPMVYYTFTFMNWLLAFTFAFWGIHTLLWFQRSVVAIIRREFEIENPTGQYIRRFSNFQRKMHGIVVVSFTGLVVTGLPLKYYYAPWAQQLSMLLGGVGANRYFHRIFGIITIGYFIFHILHMIYEFFHRKNRSMLGGHESMMPRAKDWVDFVDNLKWFFYKGERPKYDRWTYFEKFDYMAVFWGVSVIGFSGLMMWQPAFFTQFLSGEFINAASIVHSDEALLALGFIFTIHFFHNHLRVENFPIDLTIFSGVQPLERFQKERPEEYKRLVDEGRLEKFIVPAPTKKTIIKCYIFGFSALFIGVCMVWAIFLTQLGILK